MSLVGVRVENEGSVFGDMVMAVIGNIKTSPQQGKNDQTGDNDFLHKTPVTEKNWAI